MVNSRVNLWPQSQCIWWEGGGRILLGIFDQQPIDEVFGQGTGVAEVLLVELIVHRRHVGQGLLFVVSEEWRCTTQTVGSGEGGGKEVL